MILRTMIGALAFTAATVASLKAEYYGFTGSDGETVNGADIMYQETRYPIWCRATYNARWYPGVANNTSRTTFYSGPSWSGTDAPGTMSVGYIQTFWGISNPVNVGDSVKPEWWAPNMVDDPSVGEGASGKVRGNWTMTSGVWYPSVVRVWRPTGLPADTAKCGQWFKDGVTGRWHHMATFNIPFSADRFSDNGGFIENRAGVSPPHRVDFRNFYARKSTGWIAGKRFYASTRAQQKGTSGLIENDTAAFFEESDDPSYSGNMSGNQTLAFVMTMPDTPTFDPPVVSGVAASTAGGRLVVNWTLGATSSPQFAYKVDVFPTTDTSGTPAMSVTKIDPDTDRISVDYAGATPTVRVTITDVFDATATSSDATAAAATPAAATPVSGAVPGLAYAYYEGSWTSVPDFTALTPARSGVTNGVDLSVRVLPTKFACRYTGYLDVPADGLWTFALRSSDGSKLIVDGATVADNDGVHGGGYEKVASVALAAGTHAVEVRYFKGDTGSGDEASLALTWEGPGVAKSAVPDGAWKRSPSSSEPVVTLLAPAPGSTVPADASGLAASVSGTSEPLQAVRFYDGATCRSIAYASVADGGARVFVATDPLGAGAANLRARLIYGANGEFSADSPAVAVATTQPDVSPWQFSAIGPHAFSTASSVKDGVHTITGDNLNLNWRLVSGDTTIVSRIRRRPSTAWISQDDGTGYDSNWSGGVIFRSDLNPRPGSEIGYKFVTLLSSVSNGLYLQDNTNVSNSGLYWGPNLQNATHTYNWLKLTRTGNVFTAFLSVDGVTWDAAGTRDMSAQGFPSAMYVGVYTLARPSVNTNPNIWQFDNVYVGPTPPPPSGGDDYFARWAMNEGVGFGVTDASGRGFNGVTVGNPAWVPGVAGTAIDLNGTTQSVRMPPLSLNSNTITISGWVKRDGAQPAWAGLAYSRGYFSSGMMLGGSNDLRFSWNGSYWTFSSGLVIPDGVWTFVAMTVEPTKITLYMKPENGVAASASLPASYAVSPFENDFYLGWDTMSTARRFKGAVDDFRVWKRTLTIPELDALAAGNHAPTFADPALSRAAVNVGTAYSGTIAGTGTDADAEDRLVYSKDSGPAWLVVGADGTLSGTPPAGSTGMNTFTIRVTDIDGAYALVTLTIPVNAAGSPPDGDGDGFSDALETATGTDPDDPGSHPDAVYAGLRDWWMFDETTGTVAADATGRTGSDGVLLGGATHVAGRTGNAVALDGLTQSVKIPPLSLNSNTVTISGWVKRDGVQAGWAGIAYARGAQTSGITLGGASDLHFTWNGGYYTFASGLVIPDGVWTFVAMTVEPTKVTLYMKPESGVASTAVCNGTFAVSSFSSDFYLGWDTWNTARRFKGSMDDFRVWDRTLTVGELDTVAADGSGTESLRAGNPGEGMTAAPVVAVEPVAGTASADVPLKSVATSRVSPVTTDASPGGSGSGASSSEVPVAKDPYKALLASPRGAEAATLLLMLSETPETFDDELARLENAVSPALASALETGRDFVFDAATRDREETRRLALAGLRGLSPHDADVLLVELNLLASADGEVTVGESEWGSAVAGALR